MSEIYTIGHSNYSFDKLIEMLKKYEVNCVIDIRAVPYSKYNDHFDKEIIKYSLNKAGLTSIYMGYEFGAKRDNRSTYNEMGYCDFNKLIFDDQFLKGIDRLKKGLQKGYKIALLGAMQEPIRCPRSILLGRYLEDIGIRVKHIVHSGEIKTQVEIEHMLLEKYFPDRNQITIEDLIGTKRTEKEMIEEGYRIANKEIGYRLEHKK